MTKGNLEQQIQYVLSLPKDFDGDGSPSYERETVDKAVRYIQKMQELARTQRKILIENPRLLPGPNGSIDLHWKNEKYEILLNVPKGDSPASYFMSHGSDEIRGQI